MVSSVQRGEPNGISVLISGAGIGGLMAALECWRIGCTVRILERTPSSSTGGDSFTIGPSAINAFKDYPEMQRRCDEIGYNPLFELHKTNGEEIQGPFEFEDMLSKDSSGKVTEIYRHSRPKFHAMLLEQLEKVGLRVEFGREVVDYFDICTSGGVLLRDGTRLEADLVIAADGLRTASCILVAGQPVPARSSGNAGFRVAYPAPIALADPVIAEHFGPTEEGRSVMQMWVGADTQAVFWLNEDQMTWALQHPDTGTAEESWSNHVSLEEAMEFTKTIPDWPEYADRVIRATPQSSVIDFKLMWRDPQPKWTSPSGRVIQLGDAAHTFLPSSGNGGTQALEDAISLVACLSMAGKENIAQATRVHNLLRFQRVSCLQAFGVLNRESRNTKKNKDISKLKPTLGRWLVEHDPEAYAREKYADAAKAVEDGREEKWRNTNVPPGMEYRDWTIDGLVEALERGDVSGTILGSGDWSS